MEIILTIVLLVDTLVAIKILGSMIRAKFNKEVYINEAYWCRWGMLIVFHVTMLVIAAFTKYISLIVSATL